MNGSMESMVAVELTPINVVRTTDPQDAHPTPSILNDMPTKEMPTSFFALNDCFK